MLVVNCVMCVYGIRFTSIWKITKKKLYRYKILKYTIKIHWTIACGIHVEIEMEEDDNGRFKMIKYP